MRNLKTKPMEYQIRLFRSEEIECIIGGAGKLGKGSYGIVRLGFHRIHGVVAVKCSVVSGGRRKMNQMERKIKNEIQMVQRAHENENIVRVYGWTQWPDAIAIVMEYLPGGNLMEALEDHDVTLEPLLRLRMCYEAANGIAFIHNLSPDKRIVHGDVKAENILLTEGLHCKLADFGGARLSAITGGSTATHRGQQTNHYTELYASPEVLEDPTAPMRPPHDTYSFSVLMYAVIGRELPLLSDAQLKIYLEKVKQGHRLNIDVINDAIRDLGEERRTDDVDVFITLKELMEECWKQNSSDRPLMIDVKNALYELLARQDSVKIQQHAVDAARQMEMENVSRGQHDCVPLHRFYPPLFNFIRDSASVSQSVLPERRNSVSPTSANIVVSSLPTPGGTREIEHCAGMTQQLLRNIQSIKLSLQNKQVVEAVNQCQQLVTFSSINVTEKFETIIDDVVDIASSLNDQSHYVTALSMMKWLMPMFEKIRGSDGKLKKMRKCRWVVGDVMDAKFEADKKADIKEECLPLLQQLLEQVKLVQTEDVKLKAKVEAGCMNDIGTCYYYNGDYEQADAMRREAIHHMESVCGEDYKKYRVVAGCYYSCGLANYNMGKYYEAEKLFKQSIEMHKSAQDISEEYKKKWIANAEGWLSEIRSETSNQ